MATKKKKQITFRSAEIANETIKATIASKEFEPFEIEFKRPSSATRLQAGLVFGSDDSLLAGAIIVEVIKKCVTGWTLEEKFSKDAIDRIEDSQILFEMFTKIMEYITAEKNS